MGMQSERKTGIFCHRQSEKVGGRINVILAKHDAKHPLAISWRVA